MKINQLRIELAELENDLAAAESKALAALEALAKSPGDIHKQKSYESAKQHYSALQAAIGLRQRQIEEALELAASPEGQRARQELIDSAARAEQLAYDLRDAGREVDQAIADLLDSIEALARIEAQRMGEHGKVIAASTEPMRRPAALDAKRRLGWILPVLKSVARHAERAADGAPREQAESIGRILSRGLE
jgi:hypothetical protein